MKELKKAWKQNEFQKCYLFYGTEAYLIQNYEETLKKALLPPGTETMNFDLLEGKQATANAIMDIAETMPFLNEKRLIVVHNSEFFRRNGRKEEGEALVEFIKKIPESTCILFVEEKAEKIGKLYKAIAKEGKAVEFQPLSEKDMIAWLQKLAKQGGLTLSSGAAVHLLRLSDAGMAHLQGEVEKLIAYKDGTGEITTKDIDAVCTVSLEAKVFDMIRAMGEKKPERAVSIYENLLALKESPFMILSLITRQFRMILCSSVFAADGMPPTEIAKRLEVRDFAVKEYLRQSRSFALPVLKQALRDCLQTDLDIKNGRMADAFAVELLLIQYSSRA